MLFAIWPNKTPGKSSGELTQSCLRYNFQSDRHLRYTLRTSWSFCRKILHSTRNRTREKSGFLRKSQVFHNLLPLVIVHLLVGIAERRYFLAQRMLLFGECVSLGIANAVYSIEEVINSTKESG